MIGLPLSAADLLAALADHLWQSTWVAAGAALLVWIFRRHRASVRAAIWLAATLKFVIPLAALVAVGRVVPWSDVPAKAPAGAVAVVQAVSQPFTPMTWDASPRPADTAVDTSPNWLPRLLLAIWLCGTVLTLSLVIIRARHVRRALARAPELLAGRERDALVRVAGAAVAERIAICSAAVRSSPCVVGVWRPAILWPDGLSARLSDVQIDAVVQHELCHVVRRDNLAAIAQAAVQVLFWFHPLVWWMGARWNDERERACDEQVLARAYPPEPYAEGLISVGEFCVTPRLTGHATITGSQLTERIEAIMTQHTPKALNAPARVALVVGAVVLVAVPVFVGATTGSTQMNVQVADVAVPAPGAAVPAPVPFVRDEPAQQTTAAPLARVGGSVIDLTGASVAAVTVTFTPVGNTAPARSAVTDIDGRFSLRDVPDGEYEVRFTQAGFRSVTQRANIRGGYTTALTVTLPLGSLTEMVTVRGSAAPAEAPAIAEGEWQQRLNAEPDNIALYLELAELYYRQARFVESENLMTQAATLRARSLPGPIAPGSMAGQRGGAIRPPQKTRDVRPVYPQIAVSARVSGSVVLEASIGRDGFVNSARILRSLPLLDHAALGAVRLWRFTPTLLNGQPVDVAMTVTINFELPQEGKH